MQKRLTEFFGSPGSSTPQQVHSTTPKRPFSSLQPLAGETPSPHSLSDADAGTTPPVKRRRTTNKRKNNERPLHQTIIDAGQRRIGLEQCQQCGMVYNVDESKDLEMHKAYHNRFSDKRPFRVTVSQLDTWRRTLVFEEVGAPLKGVLFRLNRFSLATLRRKTEELVQGFVNEELGYCADLPIWDAEGLRQALVFIAEASGEPAFVGGLVLIDRVDKVTLMPQRKHFHGEFLGVNRIWVHSQARRKGIATLLLDAARRMLVSGGVLPKSRVAFSEPTEDGIKLATSYICVSGGEKENQQRYIAYALVDQLQQPQQQRRQSSQAPPEKTSSRTVNLDANEAEEG